MSPAPSAASGSDDGTLVTYEPGVTAVSGAFTAESSWSPARGPLARVWPSRRDR
jgi:hypothetical protein